MTEKPTTSFPHHKYLASVVKLASETNKPTMLYMADNLCDFNPSGAVLEFNQLRAMCDEMAEALLELYTHFKDFCDHDLLPLDCCKNRLDKSKQMLSKYEQIKDDENAG